MLNVSSPGLFPILTTSTILVKSTFRGESGHEETISEARIIGFLKEAEAGGAVPAAPWHRMDTHKKFLVLCAITPWYLWEVVGPPGLEPGDIRQDGPIGRLRRPDRRRMDPRNSPRTHSIRSRKSQKGRGCSFRRGGLY